MIMRPRRRSRRVARAFGPVLFLTLALGLAGCSDAGSGSESRGAAPNSGQRPPAGKGLGGGHQVEEPGDGQQESPDDSAYLSTFGLDVDTASYSYARRTLLGGRRPEPSTVRPEEFVNYFRQDYPEPAGNGFSVSTDGARMGSADAADVRLVRIGLRTRAVAEQDRRDANLTFVVDTSGSMAEPGRLDLVQDALRTLVSKLRPTDSVAIVAYSAEARLLRPMTPARDRAALEQAISELRPGDATNLEGGMLLGYQEARRAYRPDATNRVILASDGIANVGNTTAEPILRQVADQAAKGVTLLCVGVGNDYGDELMESLADRGNGMAVYVSEREEARSLFVERLPANLDLRARDAKAQVRFEPGAVESFRLIGYDNRALANEDFRDDSVDGGEVGPGHSVTALYAVRMRPDADADGGVGTVSVRWQDPDTREPREEARTIHLGDTETPLWSAESTRLQVSAVAAFFAEKLKNGSASGGSPEDTSDEKGPFIRSGRVPGEPTFSFADLAGQADRLGKLTRDPNVMELSTLLRRMEDVR